MNHRQIVAVALAVATAVGAVAVGVRWRATSSAGRARSAHFIGDKVVIVDQERTVRAHAVRVRVHDIHTGKELARALLHSGWTARAPDTRPPHYDCIPASPTRLWCAEMTGSDGLSLRSLETLAVVADEARLHQLAPGLAQGIMEARPGFGAPPPMVDLDDGSLLVTGKDGRLYRIGLDLRAEPEPPREVDRSDEAAFRKWATDTLHPEDLRLPAHAVAFESGSGLTHRATLAGHSVRLEQAEAAGPRQRISVDATPRFRDTYLDAGILADPDWQGMKPVVLDGKALVLAYVVLSRQGRQLVLQRFESESDERWSREFGDEKVLGAHLTEHVLAVVLRDSLVGLDPATGAVRYRQPF